MDTAHLYSVELQQLLLLSIISMALVHLRILSRLRTEVQGVDEPDEVIWRGILHQWYLRCAVYQCISAAELIPHLTTLFHLQYLDLVMSNLIETIAFYCLFKPPFTTSGIYTSSPSSLLVFHRIVGLPRWCRD